MTDKTCHIDGRSNRPSETDDMAKQAPAAMARRFLDEIPDGRPDSADMSRAQRDQRATNHAP
jgi:hypothetical protein